MELGDPDLSRAAELGEGSYWDKWGVVRTMPPDGFYYDLTGPPMVEEASPEVIDSYPWPDPNDPGRYRGQRSKRGSCGKRRTSPWPSI